MTAHHRPATPAGRPRLLLTLRVALLAVPVLLMTAAIAPITSSSLTGHVVVATADGHLVKGNIQSVTPELLTVLPDPKPATVGPPPIGPSARSHATAAPPADPSPPPEPVAMEWKDVKHTSNGLTFQAVLDIWKAQHASQLCPTCRGERTIWCPTCKGTNHDPAAAANCKTCHGELLVPCKSHAEADGVIPCPNGCLRLNAGSWTKGKDGKMQVRFPVGGGNPAAVFHESAVGDVVVVDLKAHSAIDAGKCPICGGTGKIDDPLCHGTGKVPCPECLARRSAGPCPDHCASGRVVCPDCAGTGLKKT